MLAFTGISILLDKARKDLPAAQQVIHDYFATLKEGDPGWDGWHYILKEREDGRRNHWAGFLGNIEDTLRYSDDIAINGPWAKVVGPKLRKIIAAAGKTHNPKDDRQRFFMELGRGSDCNSDDIPAGDKIGLNTFDGLQVISKEQHLLECKRNDAKDTHVSIRLNSWKGISIGAEHYYAKLYVSSIVPSLIIKKLGKVDKHDRYEVGSYYGSGGYGDHCKPKICCMHEIAVRRVLTRSDVKEAKRRGYSDRYESYTVGESFHDGFWTKEDAIAYSKKLHAELFDASIPLKEPGQHDD